MGQRERVCVCVCVWMWICEYVYTRERVWMCMCEYVYLCVCIGCLDVCMRGFLIHHYAPHTPKKSNMEVDEVEEQVMINAITAKQMKGEFKRQLISGEHRTSM
jgi:hypothetical protein